MPIFSSKLYNSPVNKDDCSHLTDDEKEAESDEGFSYVHIFSARLKSPIHPC